MDHSDHLKHLKIARDHHQRALTLHNDLIAVLEGGAPGLPPKKALDRSAIMKKAWAKRRAKAKANGGEVTHATA